MKTEINPMQRQSRQPPSLLCCRRCGAKTRGGSPCQSPAVRGRRRCRMHGGSQGSGAPEGKRNGRYNGGMFTKDAIQDRRELAGWLALVRATVKEVQE
jgi:hypothetical protein